MAKTGREARVQQLEEHAAEHAALKSELEGYRQREVQLKAHAEELTTKHRLMRSQYEEHMARRSSASDTMAGLQRQLKAADEKLVRQP